MKQCHKMLMRTQRTLFHNNYQLHIRLHIEPGLSGGKGGGGVTGHQLLNLFYRCSNYISQTEVLPRLGLLVRLCTVVASTQNAVR